MIRLRKYENRKIYDETQHCYVSLKDIEQMIKNNNEVSVINYKGEDETNTVLTRILMKKENVNKQKIIELIKNS